MARLVELAGTKQAAASAFVDCQVNQLPQAAVHWPSTVGVGQMLAKHRHSRIPLLRIPEFHEPAVLDAFTRQRRSDALAAGLQVAVVAEACASRRPSDKAAGLQRLAAAGAVMLSAEMLAFEWLRSCEDPRFKPVLALVKARPV